jgi:hypothetical protein
MFNGVIPVEVKRVGSLVVGKQKIEYLSPPPLELYINNMVSDFLVETRDTLPAKVIKFLFLCVSPKRSLNRKANYRLRMLEKVLELIMELKVVNR